MPRTEVIPLRELKIGDKFYSLSDKGRQMKFEVIGNPEFNLRAGSATRKCKNILMNKVIDKLCRIHVVRFISDQEVDNG